MNLLKALIGKQELKPYGLLDDIGLNRESLHTHFYLSGETGAGKTTIIKALLYSYLCLLERVGGLHACVKPDEASWVSDLVSQTPMKDRLIILRLGEFRFNVASWEIFRKGGSPESFTRMMLLLNAIQQRSRGGSDGEQSFWENLFHDCMFYAASICALAYGKQVTLEHIHSFITSMPGSREEIKSERYLKSFCCRAMMVAQDKATKPQEIRTLKAATEYVLSTQLNLGSKAKSAAVQNCLSILGPFMISPFWETFSQPDSTFTPDKPFEGFYAVMDVPVLVHGPAALLSQAMLFKLVVEAGLRQVKPELTTLLLRDECSSVITDPFEENLWFSVARSFKLSFWSACQNINLLTLAFGGDETAAKGWLANHITKFACGNTCTDTGRYFSTLYGEHKEHFHSFNERPPSEQVSDAMEAVFGNGGFTSGSSTSYHARVPIDSFLHLKRGGAPEYQVQSYMSGRELYPDGLPYQLVTFNQH